MSLKGMKRVEGQINASLDNISPYVRRAGSGTIPWQGRIRKIYDHQLMYFCHGNGTYTANGKNYTISQGSMILVKPNVPHTVILEGPYKYIWVHFDFFYRDDVKVLNEYVRHNQKELFKDELTHSEWIREVPLFDENFLFPDFVKLENCGLLETLFQKLLFEFQNRRTAWSIQSKALLLDIFAEVLRKIFEEDNIKTSLPHFKVFYSLVSYIEANYFNKITLDELGSLVNLSGDYVSRMFKKETSYSAMEYINYFRMKKAAELLSHNDLKIKDIAAMVGFEDEHYFSRMFRKFIGVSPREYCKMLFK